MALLDTLLVIKPSARGMVGSALDSEDQAIVVWSGEPAQVNYPPCKEYDAKLRGQGANWQNTAGIRGKGTISVKPGRDDSKGTAPAQDLAIACLPEEHQPPL
jgi:hypothetical protein